MKRMLVLSMLAVLFLLPQMVRADEEPSTEAQLCPDGKVAVTFADGNNVSTVCVDSGAQMDETVSTGVEAEDPLNYD